MSCLIKNGIICTDGRCLEGDLLVERGKIAAAGGKITSPEIDHIIDAEGLYILPGFIDLHVHLDDTIGGFPLADGYRSGSLTAVQNGITTLCNFVTQWNQPSLSQTIEQAQNKAAGHSYADYLFHLTPTRFDAAAWSDILACIEQGHRTFKFYTTYKDAGIYTGYDQLERIFLQLKDRDVQCLVHCEDETVLQQAARAVVEPSDASCHAFLRPPEAEVEAIRRVVDLAVRHEVKIHIVHVSTAGGVDIAQQAKKQAPITCETAPHYLFLDESWLKRDDGHRWMCTPPLRSAQNAEALRRRAVAGQIDLYATDHAPFQKEHKDQYRDDFRRVPNGIAGIGALPHLVYQLYGAEPRTVLGEMSLRLSAHPAQVAGIYPRKGTIAVGSDADLALINPHGVERPLQSTQAKAHETYPGFSTCLEFRHVFLRGELIVDHNHIIDPANPRGQWLKRI